MEEKTVQELIHKGFEDMKRWIEEAETPEQLYYRLTAALEVLSGENKVDFHYYLDGSSTAIDKTEKEINADPRP